MARDKLSPQEMRFCQCIIEGMTGTDAYMTVFSTKNRKTAKERASRLMKREIVANKIQEMREKISYTLAWSREQAEDKLTRIVNDSMADGNPKALANAIKAIAELNRMCGYYAPTKMQSVNIEVGASDIDAIMLNLGFKRTTLLESEND